MFFEVSRVDHLVISCYYKKSNTNKKEDNKEDNKGIKLIKEFVETLYKKMTEEREKRK